MYWVTNGEQTLLSMAQKGRNIKETTSRHALFRLLHLVGFSTSSKIAFLSKGCTSGFGKKSNGRFSNLVKPVCQLCFSFDPALDPKFSFLFFRSGFYSLGMKGDSPAAEGVKVWLLDEMSE